VLEVKSVYIEIK